MKKKIIIFDLDGTLLNTLNDLADSTNFALQQLNYPERSIDEICQFVGNGVAKLIERAIPCGKNNSNFDKCLAIFKEHYSANMYNKTLPYDGVLELLQNLKSLGYKTAVVSNKFDAAVKELCSKYFGELIDSAVGENEVCGIKKKPAPDTVLKVLKDFSLASDDAVYVGDSDVDIMTAKNSNMECISVTWGFRDRNFLIKHGADKIIDNPSQIIEYLDCLNG
ncbi:HAD hydrolase-like protein [bacterium]|nr:HAD hydrolase-like protein [bacterium]